MDNIGVRINLNSNKFYIFGRARQKYGVITHFKKGLTGIDSNKKK